MFDQIFPAGGSTLGDLLQALEDYLPVLLGLVKDGKHVRRQSSYQICWEDIVPKR